MTHNQTGTTFSIYRAFGQYAYPVFVVASSESGAILKATDRFGFRPERVELATNCATGSKSERLLELDAKELAAHVKRVDRQIASLQAERKRLFEAHAHHRQEYRS